jgi:sec-independent protein translocase protein TatC
LTSTPVEVNELTIWGHIGELRRRVLVSFLALVLTTLISFQFARQIGDILARPVGGLSHLQAIEVTENITVFMSISLLSGFLFALPVILWQLLGFIIPGLVQREKFWIGLSIPMATLFFAGGIAFSYFVMLPNAIPFLVGFMGITTMVRPGNYFSFTLNLLFWIGISFELPLVVFVLAKIRVVTAKMLAQQWRIAIVVIAILAAVITPTPDPVNMGLLMVPLCLLYLLSLLFAYIAQPKKRKGNIEVVEAEE